MATSSTLTTLIYSSSSSSFKPSSSPLPPTYLPFLPTRNRLLPRITAVGPDVLGDFGARDPFPAELESNFGEKVIGNMSTEHKILIPHAQALALSQQNCVTISANDSPLSKHDAKQLLFKVVGWRLLEEEDTQNGNIVMKLQCLWKLKDVDSGKELIKRINDVAEKAGHYPVLNQDGNHVTAVLWTEIIGGLSLNDFVVAAKIDEIRISDLLPRKRVWA
ncbi:unnamed protein product [Amaranthus hypochondriacus]